MKTTTAFQFSPPTPGNHFYGVITGLILFIYQLVPGIVLAQNAGRTTGPGPVLLKKGALTIQRNIPEPGQIMKASQLQRLKDSLRPAFYGRHYYALVQFDRLPGTAEKQGLARLGIHLFDYIPGNAYLAEIPEGFSGQDLSTYAIRGVAHLPARFKTVPGTAGDQGGNVSPDEPIAVGVFGTMSLSDAAKELEQAGATLVPTKIRPERTLFISAGMKALDRIAALPFVSFLRPQPLKDQPLNYNNRAAHGLDALNAPSGRNLQGDGVIIGMGDNADPYTHIDFAGRLIERFAASSGAHGVHTSGTAAGGGIIDPRYKGMAPHATLVNQYFSDILINTPTYITDYNMVLTSNSYTDYLGGCQNDGEYDVLSHFMDAQLSTYPTLLHDFAAGNDGGYVCTPFPGPYATVKSGYQCAKNVLTIGNLNNFTYVTNPASSAGPVNDGRLKPEIVAGGSGIISTLPNNSYGASSGTSMSCPTVTGTLALLYQRYRQLHGELDPPGALIKAVTCNTATDLGNPGPDFMYGFGSLNARTAVETIENNQYFTGSIANSGSNTITLSGIPSGLQQLKIMLYWPDAPAAPFAASTLVNDLDLTVTSPDAVIHHPLILNPDPAHVKDIAVEGVDKLNNIEQVVINQPPGGSFTLTVKGTSIPAGPQNYVIVYQLVKPSVTLEYPFGNETWVPGQSEIIRWSPNDGSSNPFTLEFSPDNGSTWSTISSAIPSTSRSYTWTTPSTATNGGLIRISRNGTGYSDVSHYNFTILGQPVLSLTNPCQGYAQLIWGAVPSATGYEIMALKGDTMSTIATTTDTSWLLGGLSRDSSYWLAVRAVNGTTPGRRSLGASVQPSGGPCNLTALDKDLSVDSLIAPLTGRQFTTSQLGSGTPVKVEIKNLGTIPASSPFTLSYRVNGGSIVSEPVNSSIPPNSTYVYTFTNTYDFSATGSYDLQIWVSYPGDPQGGNDTLHTFVKQLANAPLTLNPSFTEGFETAAPASYTIVTKGFTGLDRCDFTTSNTNGRARTFINTGFARTGSRSAILDQLHLNTLSTSDSLVTTFNLSNYSVSDQIWLDFYYRNQGIDFTLPGNKVWIRGSDQSAWIPVYTLDTTFLNIGTYQPSTHIDVSGILAHAIPAQTISSSFQVLFGEQGYTSANSVITDGNLDNGYSFDDITLTRAVNDLSVISLVTPNLSGICNLSAAEPISIWVKNYSATQVTNIPVSYSVNGVTVTEQVPLINGKDSVLYHFSTTANLSAWQNYQLTAWVSYPGDSYPLNDTLVPVSFQTTPVIATFPYLEGFEQGPGYWFTNGVNSSWQWGTPTKLIINRAAGGSKCWVTSLTGNYNNNEFSYLNSPCFDLSGLNSPVLSFSHIFRTEDNCDCDYHWVEYSTDGINWTKLGVAGAGTNWYDNAAKQAWQQSYTRWHVSSIDIPVRGSKVRFRFVMKSDQSTNYDGIGIDDIHIFDKLPIYHDSTVNNLSQPVSGNNWVNFDLGGSRIVGINPNGQDLGNTRVAVYFHAGPVRNDGKQYYGNRNIVIQPSNVPADSVGVRYYFLDAETDSLIAASGCDSCINIKDAYQTGIMQYSSPVLAEEDSILSNDIQGTFHFLAPNKDVHIIPYDSGYYAEYKVSGFSEFWLNTGTPGKGQPLPLALLSFTAARSGSGALLQWATTGEHNTSRFIIEKSHDGASFSALDSVKATGDSGGINSYHFMDYHLWDGVNYYRLKMVDIDGRYTWSPVRSVQASFSGLVVSLYPNPVRNGILYVSTSVACRSIRVTDVSGRVVLQTDARGFLNTLNLGGLMGGIYFVKVQTEAGTRVDKILLK